MMMRVEMPKTVLKARSGTAKSRGGNGHLHLKEQERE